MLIFKDCAICGSKSKSKILYRATLDPQKINEKLFSARRFPDRIHYQINKCLGCGLIFSSPILPEKKINSLYCRSDIEYSELTPYLNQTYYNHLKSRLKTGSRDIKILDVGCGNGFFLEMLQSRGIKEVYGIEPSRKAKLKSSNFLKNRIKNEIFKSGVYPLNFFDVITCFHTLDHVSDPNSFLQDAYGILKRNGFTFFVVHNCDSFLAKAFGEKLAIFDIEHIYLFNKHTLKLIFRKNGFKKIKIFPVKNRYTLFYLVKMSPIPKSFKMIVLDILGRLNLGQKVLPLSQGNIGIMAVKD